MSPAEKAEIQRQVTEGLKRGIIVLHRMGHHVSLFQNPMVVCACVRIIGD